jgi:hypothetical protein
MNKLVGSSLYADPKIVEIAYSFQPVQDSRIYIEVKFSLAPSRPQ